MKSWPFGAAATAVLLGACSGGGGAPAPSPTPMPSNAPPTFTSGTTVSVAENTAGAFYTATATDPEGAAVTYRISGGADQSLFAITSAGALSFTAPPDYEAPADADRDHVYVVQIAASDGVNSATLTLNVTVTDVQADDFIVGIISAPFAGTATPLTFLNQLGAAVAEDRPGATPLNPSSGQADFRFPGAGNIGADFSTTGERGMLGWTTAPRAPAGGWSAAQVASFTAANGDVVLQWCVEDFFSRGRCGPGGVIWRIPNTAIANLGGWIAFGTDGYLYVALGDATAGANAQDPASPFGKLMRIDPYRDDFPADGNRNFGVPAVGMIAASGLRNPYRFSIDELGNIYIADRGNSVREEINTLGQSESDVNFGWPYFEGTARVQAGGPAALRAPALELEHGAGPRQSSTIVGGRVYTGPIASLRGHYIFGDARGAFWMVPRASLLAGGLTGADLILNDETFVAPNRPIQGLRSFDQNTGDSLAIIDNSGFQYRLVAR